MTTSQTVSRREFIREVAAGATCATVAGALGGEALGAQAATPGAARNRYNVLFLMSDEHSPLVLGCGGNKIAKTPALDSLAKQGVLFTAAYTQNPVCIPSRASFVTGRMACHLKGGEPTMGTVFTKAGYVTLWAGKEHWTMVGDPGFNKQPAQPKKIEGERIEALGLKMGANSRLPKDAYIAPWPAKAEGDTVAKEWAVKFLEENKDKKFFLGVSFRKPHFPFFVQQEYYDLYKDADIPAPRVSQEMLDDLPEPMKSDRETYKIATVTEEQAKKARAIYYGMVTFVDEQIGGILRKVDELGLREKTVILYTADHGEMLGQHGVWYKNCYYEGSARVPFIWSLPGVFPQGVTIEAPVMNLDIFPTLCELCGVPAPDGLEGSSLLPLIGGTEDGKQRYALSENRRVGMHSRMIRTWQWKYAYYEDGKEWLFDMRRDPEETRNLARDPEYRSVVAELKPRALQGWVIPPRENDGKAGKQGARDDESAPR